MKKLILPLFGLSLVFAACEGEQTKQTAEPAANAAPVAVAPVAKAVPEANVNTMEKANGKFAKNVQIRTIDWNKAEELAAAGGLYVDVRYPEELKEGYVLNSINVPLNEIKHRLGEIPRDRDLLVYCRSGRRSEAATNLLQNLGYERVYNVAGGFIAFPKK